ncbi:hypothetical protein [Brevundimonas sp. GN22]
MTKVVRQIDLLRVVDALSKRGIVPAAIDVLPGGAVRLHSTSPSGVPAASDEEAAKWDEALR